MEVGEIAKLRRETLVKMRAEEQIKQEMAAIHNAKVRVLLFIDAEHVLR